MNKCTAMTPTTTFTSIFVHHVRYFQEHNNLVIYASDKQDWNGNRFTLVYDFDNAKMVGNALVRLDDDVSLLNIETAIVSYEGRILDELDNIVKRKDGKPLTVTKTRFRITKRIKPNDLAHSAPSWWDEIYRVPWTAPDIPGFREGSDNTTA